jgi:hypothetical protein
MQPFLGPIRPILIVSNLRLEVIYPVLGSSNLIVCSSKLVRKFPISAEGKSYVPPLVNVPRRRARFRKIC